MMKGIAGNGTTSKVLLREWLKSYTVTNIVGTQTVPTRSFVRFFQQVIRPWLELAYSDFTAPLIQYGDSIAVLNLPTNLGPLNEATWETFWDAANEDKLLHNAPFRLMAISNRIDLRGSSAYKPSSLLKPNLGETRFIFTLISTKDEVSALENVVTGAGMPVRHGDQLADNSLITNNPLTAGKGFIDWEGFNVILEYGNVGASMCDLRDQARDWLQLSDMTIYPEFPADITNAITSDSVDAYCAALQALTDHVTLAGVNNAKVNGSAINQIRSNERLFTNPSGINESGWDAMDWQLRQFELDPVTKVLALVPVSNTCVPQAMKHDWPISPPGPSGTFTGTLGKDIINWASKASNKVAAAQDRVHIPFLAPGTSTQLLAASANLGAEQFGYFEFGWTDASTSGTYYTASTYTNSATDWITEKAIRKGISLNQCQGCHGGETKTLFTVMHPRGYGQPAVYWGENPSFIEGIAKPNAHENWNETEAYQDPNTGTLVAGGINHDDEIDPGGISQTRSVYPVVAAFMTGRDIRGYTRVGQNKVASDFRDDFFDNGSRQVGVLEFFGEDNTDPASLSLNDNTITGMYYVRSPSNMAVANTAVSSPHKFNQYFGYNDLMRRAFDLCEFVQSDPCSKLEELSSPVLNLFQSLGKPPKPPKSS
jgi:hypothetical protein